VRSIIGDVTAAVTRPTTIKRAPAIPAWSSEKEYGSSIWFIRDEMELKRPTRILKGMNIIQNSGVEKRVLREGTMGCFGVVFEWEVGVGG
jgi:hypothetical protein